MLNKLKLLCCSSHIAGRATALALMFTAAAICLGQLATQSAWSDEPPAVAAEPAAPKALTKEEKQAVADFHELYRLDENQVVKYIKPPFPPGRLIDRKLRWKDRWGNADHGQNGMFVFRYLFYERDGKLEIPFHFAAGSRHPDPKDDGADLLDLIAMITEPRKPEIDDPEKLLNVNNVGDYVIRADAPLDKVVAELGEILKRDCGVPIKLELRDVAHPSVIVRGRITPPYELNVNSPYQLYAETLQPNRGDLDTGTYREFLDDVGRFITPNRRVINEIENPPNPSAKVSWHRNIRLRFDDKTLRKDRSARPVLDHLEQQTGLTFTMDSRKFPTIVVERVK